ncbi:ScbA/BarX family gamma-butyrolactone biosynthesis protein, partial [Streptomyces humidus]|uniref:ScbA/BarX family gamma-butyrolactone biosynthesis protein n=1 Tax=Streptomyces humidus TaxID=52259 RepID=UPI00167E974D
MTVTASTRVIERPATSVPREYVHKAAASEVLLTGLSPAGPDRFHITARWPSQHPFYGPKTGFHDPLLVAESVRQSVPLLSHLAYAVPFGHRQSWSSLRYEVDPAALTFTGNDADLDMHITCSETVRRTGRLASLRMQVDLYIDGRPLGVAETRFCNLSPTVYPRLRGPYADPAHAARRALPLPPPLTPAHVARTHTHDVVLSPTPTPTPAQLRTDFSHPVLFDHPADHVPGMLLLEAARQS